MIDFKKPIRIKAEFVPPGGDRAAHYLGMGCLGLHVVDDAIDGIKVYSPGLMYRYYENAPERSPALEGIICYEKTGDCRAVVWHEGNPFINGFNSGSTLKLRIDLAKIPSEAIEVVR